MKLKSNINTRTAIIITLSVLGLGILAIYLNIYQHSSNNPEQTYLVVKFKEGTTEQQAKDLLLKYDLIKQSDSLSFAQQQFNNFAIVSPSDVLFTFKQKPDLSSANKINQELRSEKIISGCNDFVIKRSQVVSEIGTLQGGLLTCYINNLITTQEVKNTLAKYPMLQINDIRIALETKVQVDPKKLEGYVKSLSQEKIVQEVHRGQDYVAPII